MIMLDCLSLVFTEAVSAVEDDHAGYRLEILDCSIQTRDTLDCRIQTRNTLDCWGWGRHTGRVGLPVNIDEVSSGSVHNIVKQAKYLQNRSN